MEKEENQAKSSLKGKVVLLTGATSGIGKEIAVCLARAGARLAICGRSKDKMEQLKSELAGAEVLAGTFCVTCEQDIVSFVGQTLKHFGQIDILINNAGLNSARGKLSEVKTEDIDYMMDVNFKAPLIFTREVLKDMQPRKSGFILNIISTAAYFSNEGIGLYSATKAALDLATGVYRKELRKDGIHVCAIYPGGVNTPFRAIEKPQYMKPQSVAKAVMYMLSSPADAVVHELVLRPPAEDNFA